MMLTNGKRVYSNSSRASQCHTPLGEIVRSLPFSNLEGESLTLQPHDGEDMDWVRWHCQSWAFLVHGNLFFPCQTWSNCILEILIAEWLISDMF